MTENRQFVEPRTALDENLDQMRVILEEKGVTLESAMQMLLKLKAEKTNLSIR